MSRLVEDVGVQVIRKKCGEERFCLGGSYIGHPGIGGIVPDKEYLRAYLVRCGEGTIFARKSRRQESDLLLLYFVIDTVRQSRRPHQRNS